MKNNSYQKSTTAECHYCDYWTRKKCVGHKCNRYKQLSKKYPKGGRENAGKISD